MSSHASGIRPLQGLSLYCQQTCCTVMRNPAPLLCRLQFFFEIGCQGSAMMHNDSCAFVAMGEGSGSLSGACHVSTHCATCRSSLVVLTSITPRLSVSYTRACHSFGAGLHPPQPGVTAAPRSARLRFGLRLPGYLMQLRDCHLILDPKIYRLPSH